MPTRRSLVVLAATITLVAAAPARAQDKSIVVASTTSTQDSGLFGHMLPLFKAKTSIDGQAFIGWLVSPEGQKAIADYKINGQELFFPNANVPGA